MNQADDLQRNLWRMGCLITGSPHAATDALVRVLTAHPDPARISLERARRLLLIHLRDIQPTQPGDPRDLPPDTGRIWRSLASMQPLQREAWTLLETIGATEVEASRITGVPRSALASYLAEARERIRADLAPEDPAPAIRSLRSWATNADCTEQLAEASRRLRGAKRRRRFIAAAQLALLLIAMATLAWIGRDLLRSSERERERRALQQEISNPMTQEESAKIRRRDSQGGSP